MACYVLIGLLGFAFMAGADWAIYKKISFLKPVLWFLIIPAFFYAIVMAWVDTARFSFPSIISTVAWVPLLLFFGLFIYSAYIEIPLKKTYINSSQPTRVVTDGTYSLCRHPAALWFGVWVASAVLASRSVTLAVALLIWLVAYIGCIFVEEKLSCLGDFGDDYKRYQEVTPMLIPTLASIGRFWKEVRSLFRLN